jgi:hypothetical protein
MPYRILILRWVFALAGALVASEGFAHPIDCTPRYSDSHCVTPIRSGAIPAPTCPSAPGYSTITPAVWAGYRWTQPECSSYQAPPTCPTGYVQTTAPSWNGSAWIGMSCEQPVPRQPDGPTTCLNAASSGNIMVQSLWVSPRRYVATSQFTPYVAFFQITWSGAARNWQWPTYSIYEYPSNFISNAAIYMQLPISSQNTNTWYAATYTGPSFQNDIGSIYNGYTTICSIDANGNLAGIVQMPTAPSTPN